MEKDKKIIQLNEINVRDRTGYEATARIPEKAKKDGVDTAFDRAVDMKPCPIGANSACCKHCAMGPCRLNANDPYNKVGVCEATIDTIQSRNFARMVASGTAAHSSHGRSMLNLFRGVVEEKIPGYTITDSIKLEETARSVGIETEGRELKDIALDLCRELECTINQMERGKH